MSNTTSLITPNTKTSTTAINLPGSIISAINLFPVSYLSRTVSELTDKLSDSNISNINLTEAASTITTSKRKRSLSTNETTAERYYHQLHNFCINKQ